MPSLNMMQSIESLISSRIDLFIKEIHEKHNIPIEEMEMIWKTVSTHKEKTESMSKKNKKNKKNTKLSPWLQFCHDQRALLKEKEPHLTFGEISKKTSASWKLLSDEEKKSYKSSLLTEKNDENTETDTENDSTKTLYVSTSPEEVSTIKTKPKIYSNDELSNMKTKELKEICGKFELSKTGKKQELVDRILNCQKSLPKQDEDNKSTTTEFDEDHDSEYDFTDNEDDEY
jgi:hypothetical protein